MGLGSGREERQPSVEGSALASGAYQTLQAAFALFALNPGRPRWPAVPVQAILAGWPRDAGLFLDAIYPGILSNDAGLDALQRCQDTG